MQIQHYLLLKALLLEQEACDLLTIQLQDRFSDTEYTEAFTLIKPSLFRFFNEKLPEETLTIACPKYRIIAKESFEQN